MARRARLLLLFLWRALARWPWIERRLVLAVNRRFAVGVLGIFRDPDGRVLLLDHGRYRRRWPWGLPGGWHRPGETLTGTIERELREETGLAARVESFFHVVSAFGHPRLEFVVTGSLGAGEPRLTEEVRGYRLVSAADDYSMIVPRHKKLLDLYFAGRREGFESAFSSLAAGDPGQ